MPNPEYVHTPIHPAFVGEADVPMWSAHVQKKLDGKKYRVNLLTGTCTCKDGKAEHWDGRHNKWVPNVYCSHKVRAIADIVETAGRPSDMMFAYAKVLASRYNVFEVVSAFHKELRKGSVERAVFWGSILSTFRGVAGVYRYLLNIMYEETRDHTFNRWLLDRIIEGDTNYNGMCKAIVVFCKSKKKWGLPHRYAFLEAEMRGYQRLIAEFGRDVAKGSNIIPASNKDKLVKAMLDGFKAKDLAAIQYGLKGLQKLSFDPKGLVGGKNCDESKLIELRAEIANLLLSSPFTKIARMRKGFAEIEALVTDRAGNGLGIGYHELNALADACAGENLTAGNTTPEALKEILAAPAPLMRLAVTPQIPPYAHDNHTWAGKALIRRFPDQWQPGAEQTDMDLRMCGAYIGVSWRHLAVKQFGNIECAWGRVEWPDWWGETVGQLWY